MAQYPTGLAQRTAFVITAPLVEPRIGQLVDHREDVRLGDHPRRVRADIR